MRLFLLTVSLIRTLFFFPVRLAFQIISNRSLPTSESQCTIRQRP